MYENEPATESGMITVVSRIMRSEMPSRPTAYRIPQRSIHGKDAVFWNSAVPSWKVQKSGSDRPRASRVANRAVQRALLSGPARHPSAPRNGIARRSVRIQ
jgi:hypothetical protein